MNKFAFTILLCSAITTESFASEFTQAQICKAVISVEMARPSISMRTDKAGDIPVISYIRNDDQQEFIYRCMFQGNRVIWSAYFPEDQGWGRWRNSTTEYGDAMTTYQFSNGKLTIINDQLGKRTFSAHDLKQ